MLFRFSQRRLCAAAASAAASTASVSTTPVGLDVAPFDNDTAFAVDRAVIRRHIATTALPLSGLWGRCSRKAQLIDEFNDAKPSRRLAQLSATVRYLVGHNVLLHSVLRLDAQTRLWHVTPEFGRVALVGEAWLASEAATRVAALFPDASAADTDAVASRAVNAATAAALFDALRLHATLPAAHRRERPLTPEQKAQMLFAIAGEARWFIVKTKATDRTHNNALFPPSDALVLHVLCCHALECIVATLLFDALTPLLAQELPSWRNFHASTVAQWRRAAAVPARLSLNAVATVRTASEPFVPRPTAPALAASRGDAGFWTKTEPVVWWQRMLSVLPAEGATASKAADAPSPQLPPRPLSPATLGALQTQREGLALGAARRPRPALTPDAQRPV